VTVIVMLTFAGNAMLCRRALREALSVRLLVSTAAVLGGIRLVLSTRRRSTDS